MICNMKPEHRSQNRCRSAKPYWVWLVSLSFSCCSCGTQNDNGTPLSRPDATDENAVKVGLTVYNVIDFGAVGDGQSLDTTAIQRTIDSAAVAGGGTVYFPPGTFLSGTLQLKDNTSLYLSLGSTLSGSKNLQDYDQEKTHLIFADDAHNISIRGAGVIDGNGPSFWDNGRLEQWLQGEIELPRTKDMIRFDQCENVRLEQVRIKDGAFWNIGFGDCHEIAIDGIRIRTGVYENDGPNTDGINLWNCTNVTISDCDIVTGDDCIVVLGNSRDVTITNCQLQTSETALMISGVQNLAFSNSTIRDSGCGIGFRVWTDILVDGVTIDNITLSTSKRYQGGGTAIYIWSFPIYTETIVADQQDLPPPGVIRNVNISNFVATANGLVCVNGYQDAPVEGLTLDNVQFTMFGGKQSEYNDKPPYPYPIYGFHNASPYGMFFRYVDDLALRNVRVRWQEPERADWGSALRCWNVNHLELAGFFGRHAAESTQPTVSLQGVSGALIRDCRAANGTGTFLELLGGTKSVSLIGNELFQSITPVDNQSGHEYFSANNHLPEK